MLNSKLRGLTALAAACAAVAVAPAAASAAPPCPSGALCVWTLTSGNGGQGNLYDTNDYWNSGWNIFENDESSRNRSIYGSAASVWTGYQQTGTRASCILAGQSNSSHNPRNRGRSNRFGSAGC